MRTRLPGLVIVVGLPCILIEALLLAADAGIALPRDLRLFAFGIGAFWPGLLRDWAPVFAAQPVTMFLSYGFLHAGAVHLAVNMLSLLALALPVSERLGARGLALVYLAALVAGGVAYGALSAADRPMVGASGAIFGLAGAVAAFELRDGLSAGRGLGPAYRFVAVIAGLNLVLWWATGGQIAWQAHLGGFLAGGGLGWGLPYRPRRPD